MTIKLLFSLAISLAATFGAVTPGQLLGVSAGTTNALPSGITISPAPSVSGVGTNIHVPGNVFSGDLVSTNLGANKIPVTDLNGKLVPLNIGSGLSQTGTNLDLAPVTATGSLSARSVSDRFAEEIRVEDYTNGVSFTTALQNAIYAAASNKVVTIGFLNLIVTNSIYVPPYTYIRGAKRSRVDDPVGSRITASHSGPIFILGTTNESELPNTEISHITFENLSAFGGEDISETNQHGVYYSGNKVVRELTFIGTDVSYNGGSGLCLVTGDTNGVLFLNCQDAHFRNNRAYGFYFYGQYINANDFRLMQVQANVGGGFLWQGPVGSFSQANQFTVCDWEGNGTTHADENQTLADEAFGFKATMTATDVVFLNNYFEANAVGGTNSSLGASIIGTNLNARIEGGVIYQSPWGVVAQGASKVTLEHVRISTANYVNALGTNVPKGAILLDRATNAVLTLNNNVVNYYDASNYLIRSNSPIETATVQGDAAPSQSIWRIGKLYHTFDGNVIIGTNVDQGDKWSVVGGRRSVMNYSAANDTDTLMDRVYAGTDATLGPLKLDLSLRPSATAANRLAHLQLFDAASYRPFALQPFGGNVLVGHTNDGGFKLDVYGGPVRWDWPMATNDGPNIINRWQTGSDGTLGALKLDLFGVPSATAGNRHVYLEAYDTANYRHIILQPRGGRIGIGTTNPATAMDVNGTITASAVTLPSGGVQAQIDGKQAGDPDLTAVAGQSGTGLYVRSGAGTGTTRTLTGDSEFVVTNGDGVSGNPSGAIGAAMTRDAELGGSNLGASGEGIFASMSGTTHQFKKLVAGSNVSLSSDANSVTINATGGGGGSGDDVYVNGSNVTNPDFDDTIDIALTVSGTNVSAGFARTEAFGGSPALSAGHVTIGSSGIIFEGTTADGFEGWLTSGGTLTADRLWVLPSTDTFIPVIPQVLTIAGPTSARTITLPDANFTAARTDAAQTFSGVQTFSSAPVIGDFSSATHSHQDAAGGGTLTGSAIAAGTVAEARIDSAIARLAGPTFTGTVTVPAEAYVAGWSGDPAAARRDDIYDQLHIGDADDDGKLDVLDQTAGIANTDANGALQAPLSTTGSGNVMRTRSGMLATFTVAAGAWTPSTTNGAAAGTYAPTGSANVTKDYYLFDDTTSESIQLDVFMPANWDASTVKAQPLWTTAAASGNVEWRIAANAYADNTDISALSWSTASSTDTVQNANRPHTGPTATVTVGNTPAASKWVQFRVDRNPGTASDLTGDAGFLGLVIQFGTTTTEPSAL